MLATDTSTTRGKLLFLDHGGRMGEGIKQVRRVIQHKRTGHFLTVAGEWTADLEQAHLLPNVLSAVRLARELDLEDVDLVLKFQDGKYDVRLDL